MSVREKPVGDEPALAGRPLGALVGGGEVGGLCECQDAPCSGELPAKGSERASASVELGTAMPLPGPPSRAPLKTAGVRETTPVGEIALTGASWVGLTSEAEVPASASGSEAGGPPCPPTIG